MSQQREMETYLEATWNDQLGDTPSHFELPVSWPSHYTSLTPV